MRVVEAITSGTTTVYVYAGQKVIAEYDNGAAVTSPTREYIYGSGKLLSMISAGASNYYHPDHLSERILLAHFLLDVHGTDMSLDLTGKLRTEDGYLRFDPLSGQVGAVPIPRAVLEGAMRQVMNSPAAREHMHLSPSLSDLRVENNSFVVTYK